MGRRGEFGSWWESDAVVTYLLVPSPGRWVRQFTFQPSGNMVQ